MKRSTVSNLRQELSGAMEDQACQWIARLRAEDASEADHQQFALWLAANPAHGRAMDAVLAMWEDLEVLKHRPVSTEPAQPSRRRWIGTGLALAASLVLAILLSPGLGLGPGTEEYRTRLGEQLAVTLADSSSVKLNTDTRLLVNYSSGERQLTLVRGEAFFQVAHDPDRPFLVTAGNTEVRALGTAFNILLNGERSEITVTEGVVRVTELNAPDTRPALTELLYSDQRLAGDRGGLSPAESVDSGNLLAWRDGKLVAHDMPLGELVTELSRYHPNRIFIAEPDLTQTTVSGVFQLEDLDSILLALEHTVGVRSVALDDGSLQLIRAPL
ncbi:MAG: FecR family protein [Halieaceae bacterium]|nr:FecR family protein [Halieaceae bacterium]